MPTEPFILCENLVKIYQLDRGSGEGGDSTEVQALQGLDLTIMPGEMVGIVGASGSGKSTLLNILGGLDRPNGGRVFVNKKNLARLSPAELDKYRRETVGFVWQQGSRNLIHYLSALENIRLPLMISGSMDRASLTRPQELLGLVGLAERAGHRLDELSGGEQQRVAIAIALANRPRLLLADEPTGELDNATAPTIYDLRRALNQSLGLTVVIVSHDITLARHVDRVVAVRDGRLASETVRRPAKGAARGEKHHLEELVVLDSAGRLQIPREYLQQFNIHRRVRLETTRAGILIRPTENDVRPHDASHADAPEPDLPQASAEFEGLPGWLNRLRKPLQAARGLVARLRNRKDGEA